ncbi:MAG: phage head closure protein [Planctomycetota bacterium]
MRAGDLRHVVDFERLVKRNDTAGQQVQEWEPVYTGVPAAVTYVGGVHGRRGEVVEERSTHKVHIRYIDDINPAMRIKHEGRTYEIVSCGDPTGKRAELICTVKEIR